MNKAVASLSTLCLTCIKISYSSYTTEKDHQQVSRICVSESKKILYKFYKTNFKKNLINAASVSFCTPDTWQYMAVSCVAFNALKLA